jgi:uncharacterized protein YkwD
VARTRLILVAALSALALGAGCALGGPALAANHTGKGTVPRCASKSTFKSGSGGTRRCRHGSRRGAHAHCPFTRLRPKPWNLERVRYAVLCLVNRERARHGEAALHPNRRLRRAAQSHTDSMARGGYFAHGSPLSRMRAAGYVSRARGYEVGENIAFGTLWLATPRAIVSSWMRSAGHRANILDPRLRDSGVGVAVGTPTGARTGGTYTQDFGAR